MLQNTNTMETVKNILIVDDEVNVCRGVQRIFEDEGFLSNYALTGTEGLKRAEEEDFDLVITDLKMPDINGLDMIKRLKQQKPDTPVVMITGYASVPTAVEAMKIGAYDYIPKPFNPDEILRVVHEAMAKNRIKKAKKTGQKAAGKVIEKDQVLAVLNRTGRDMKFWRTLWKEGSNALNGFALSSEAKAAIISGDVNWIRNNYEWNDEELTEETLKPVNHFLEMERW
jgi:YesN/AraC family two-component response regulator